MLRRIPFTPLVCLVILVSTCLFNVCWAAGPDESLEILLKPNQTSAATTRIVQPTKARRTAGASYYGAPPALITKVKPPIQTICSPGFQPPTCILPTPQVGQWQIGAQALFARLRGNISWPNMNQNWWWGYNSGFNNNPSFSDSLQLPGYQVLPAVDARYQFRPRWSVRFWALGNETKGGGWVQDSFYFGFTQGSYTPYLYNNGNMITTRWQHGYYQVGLLYDAIKTCNTMLSVFGGWMHTDDRIDAGCINCGWQANTFSKSMDTVSVGLELQKCVMTSSTGGTFSFDNRATAMFADNVTAWDVQLGGRYSIPLNYGRWGYLKGGYRYINQNKNQLDYALNYTIDGGFAELGFIF
jgi:hypothetical protein